MSSPAPFNELSASGNYGENLKKAKQQEGSGREEIECGELFVSITELLDPLHRPYVQFQQHS
jgi:hypothetical protein